MRLCEIRKGTLELFMTQSVGFEFEGRREQGQNRFLLRGLLDEILVSSLLEVKFKILLRNVFQVVEVGFD